MNSQLLLVFSCLGLGFFIKSVGALKREASRTLNTFVIWISLPSLVFVQLSKLLNETSLTSELLIPVSMAWIHFALSFVVFYFLGRSLKWPRRQTGALILLAGLGNTSFVGFPILESIIGTKAIPIGILVDQPGSFLVLSTAGIFVAAALSPKSSAKIQWRQILKKVFSFPPFITLILTFLFWFLGISIGSFQPVLERLSNTLVPVALVSVGILIEFSHKILLKNWRALSLGLGFKLFLAPLFFVFLYQGVLNSHSFSTRVTILESAMATMITSGVVAEEFDFDLDLVSLMLGIGIPLSVFTVPLWNSILY